VTPPDDSETTFEDLRKMLTETGFAWVVENADIELANGVPQVYRLPRYRESDEKHEPLRPRKEKLEAVAGVRPYNSNEKLKVLVDEIERCIIIPIQIANTLTKSLSTADTPVDRIEIADDEPNTPVFRVIGDQPIGGGHISKLSTAINAIRKGL